MRSAGGSVMGTISCPRVSSALAASVQACRQSAWAVVSSVPGSVSSPMRSRCRGGVRAATRCASGAQGAWRQISPGPIGPTASRNRAASPTVRATGPSLPSWYQAAATEGIRPRLGLMPTRPQFEAGVRVEPRPSLAWASGARPAATAAAAPPLDPLAESPSP